MRVYKKQDFLKAAALFSQAAKDPHNYAAKFNQATCLFKLGRFTESLILFNNLLTMDTTLDHRLYYNVSVCYLQMGDYSSCLNTCKQFLKKIKLQSMEELQVTYNPVKKIKTKQQ